MITVLLADDDMILRESLCGLVPWLDVGMEVVGIAEDGQEALDLCRKLKPDILFTDIKMPFLTGLEVAICLQEESIDTKVVLISGIQDFNYAKTALSIHAAGYILKPIQMVEVMEVLNKLRNNIDLERNRELVMQRLSLQLSENMMLMRDKFLSGLISGDIQNMDEIADKLEYFKVPLRVVESISVAVAEIDDYAELMRNRPVQYRQFVCFSVLSMIETTLTNRHAGICMSSKDNEFIIIFNQDTGFNERDMQILDEINELIQGLGHITISVGVGSRIPSMEHTAISYRNAQTALSYKFYTGKNSIINIADVADTNQYQQTIEVGRYSALGDIQQRIMSSIKYGDIPLLRSSVIEYFNDLKMVRKLAQEYIHGLCIELIITIHRLVLEAEADNNDVFPRYMGAIQSVIKAETVDAMESGIVDFAVTVAEYFKNKYKRKSGGLVRHVKEYVDKRFMENITLADIAGEVYMSPNYICSMFKKETDETINEYIIHLKMDKAKQMLTETNMKIWEIAEKLGYENPHYFSYSFKKNTGQTPQQYRG